jgi:hypothetical protein
LGVPQIFFVSAAVTALGALGMVYVANRYKPSSVSFISARSDADTLDRTVPK